MALIGYLIEVRRVHWLVVVWLVVPAVGNDTLATLGAGGLIPRQSAEIAMEREDLQISIHQVTVRYLFRNASDKDIDATVAFPLPDLDGGMVEHVPLHLPAKDETNFVNFEVMSGGKPVETKMEVRAFHEGHDVSDKLRGAGLPVSNIDGHFADAVARLSAPLRKQMEKDELVVSDDPAGTANRRYWANWTSKVQFYWTQHFPAHGTVELVQKYRPVIGGSYIYATDNGASHVKPYCGGANAVAQIAAVKKRHPVKSGDEPVLFEKQIQYVLTTANHWKGPIGSFRLTVTADSPEDIVLTCLPGLRRVTGTRYEMVRSAFRPERELELMMLVRGN